MLERIDDRAVDASFEHSGLNAEPLVGGSILIRPGFKVESRVEGVKIACGTLIESRPDGADFDHSPRLNQPLTTNRG